MPYFYILLLTFCIVNYSDFYYICLINLINFILELAYKPKSGVITFTKLYLFILSSKVS